jgi:signal transduction histidine kinase
VAEFNQAILNLVVNAADAIAEVVGDASVSKGTIKISTRRVEGWVEIRIQDSGIGIPESVQTRIFEPFFTTKPIGKGTGQGLAIVHDVIVGRHGGTITFDSKPGQGTTFIVRLPINPN